MTTLDTPQHPRALIDLLEQQRTIYEQLLRLCERQRQTVSDGDAEALLDILAQRQVLIDQLLQISEKVEPYRRDWARFFNAQPAELRADLQQRIDGVQGLLGRILEQDREDRRQLTEHRNQIMRQLRDVGRGKALQQAYGGRATRTTPRFTDKQG